MGKTPTRYLEIHPWKISENGYHPVQSQVSESLFAIANEYSGVRGFPEEGTPDHSLIGTYFNGLYADAPDQVESGYRGITKKVHYMINAVNWVKTGIFVDGEAVVLDATRITDFYRELDFRTGELIRSYLWKAASGAKIVLTFRRFLSMTDPHAAYQRLSLRAAAGSV
ncbi:MAG: family 65 glycosyl hydrolase, partial [bacterium]